jgi:hypothetical protein
MIVHNPNQTAAAETAPTNERRVFVRDHDGGVKRAPITLAEELVEAGFADKVSRAGHVRLKPGLRIDKIEGFRGAPANVTTIGRQDRKQPHPRCKDWRQPA